MSDDIAFKIQLGLILPKLKDKLSSDLTEIVKELVQIVNAGSVDGGDFDMGPVKEIMMKDLEIFLDKEILPPIEASLAPAQEEAAAEEAPAEEEPAAE